MVKLDNLDYDKYGRLLATILHKGEDLSEWTKSNFLGVDYDGKGDRRMTDWKLLKTQWSRRRRHL